MKFCCQEKSLRPTSKKPFGQLLNSRVQEFQNSFKVYYEVALIFNKRYPKFLAFELSRPLNLHIANFFIESQQFFLRNFGI